MLIRIGDEKREMINAHIDVLKTKIAMQAAWLEDTEEVLMQTLVKVVQNLPHKVFIYAALMGLIACENPEICAKVVAGVMEKLVAQSLMRDQDAFASRNAFKWLAYLVFLGVVSPQAALSFLSQIL